MTRSPRPAIQAMKVIALKKYPATVTAVATLLIEADHRFGGDWFYLARNEMARDADISVNQVSSAIARLVKDGWVEVERHAGPSHTNRFAIRWDQLMAAHEERRAQRARTKARKPGSRHASNNPPPTGLPAEAPSKNLVGEGPKFRTQRETPKINKPTTPVEPSQQRKRALRSELHNGGTFKGPSSREVYEDGLNKRLMQLIREHHRSDELLELYSLDQVPYLEKAKKSVEAAFEALVLALCKAKPEPTAIPAIATSLRSTTASADAVFPHASDTTQMLRQLKAKPLVNEWSRGISERKDHNDVKS